MEKKEKKKRSLDSQEDHIFDRILHDLRMLTLEPMQHPKRFLVIRRSLDDVSSEDRVNVFDHVLLGLLEFASNGIADLVDFPLYDGR